MKPLLTLMIIISSQLCIGQIDKDKQLHFAAGVLIGGATNAIVYGKTKNKTKAFIWGVAVSSVAAITKEVYDEYSYGGFDTMDLGATVLGGIVVNVTFNIFEK